MRIVSPEHRRLVVSSGAVPTEFEALIAGARAGEPAAIHALLERHLPAIQALVRLKAGAAVLQRESVADLAQVGLP